MLILMKSLMILNSMITPTLKHPISMGTMLMSQTIMACSIMMVSHTNPWYSYILFITIIGGLMVMFMYMSSIASNEKFKFNTNKLVFMMLTLMVIFIIAMKDPTITDLQKIKENKMNTYETEELKTLSKFFNSKKMILTILMMLILFTVMVTVTNISSTFEGPLKMK
nr:NADH dehydrogenase subunit 6 [Acanalonia sp.]